MLTSRRCNVATLRRRDVETSRCWDVMTWGRRDVGTSRRGSHFPALLSITPVCFHSVLFSYHLHLHSPNQTYSDNSWKKYIFNLKNNTKNLRKTRVYYECFRHSSHPKLNFLLVPKQEWTLNKTHTRHTDTHTKTVLHMLRSKGSIWTDSHCYYFA